jgi:hypothetical protein
MDVKNDLKFESDYWGDCTNTFDEDQKHYVYAQYMGLQQEHYSFNVFGKSILDIGGGPTSLLLKAKNLKKGLVCDPLHYPHWTTLRYLEKNINVKTIRGEDISEEGWDEVWIYNCLQHTDDPAKIISNAFKAAKVLRIFEWVDIPPHEGHPQMITKEFLDKCIGIEGRTTELAEKGCYGKAYYNIVNI